jgi:hypothetical protein
MMQGIRPSRYERIPRRTTSWVRGVRLGQNVVCLLLIALSGCSAVYQPYARTIEHKMEVLSQMPKNEMRSIDPRLLGQTPPPEHLVGDGDILGIYIEGAPGTDGEQMPVRFSNDRLVSPAIGYPTPVRNGGFIRVPQIGVMHVRGMTAWQIEERIRHILTVEKKTNLPDESMIHVSVMWKRGVNVMVVRQEEVGNTKMLAPSNGPDTDRRTGQVIQLPAFRNDVMNALLESGGFPDDQAENAVYVFKRNDRRPAGQAGIAANAPVVPPVPSGALLPFEQPTPNQLAAYSSVVGGGLSALSTPTSVAAGSIIPAGYSQLKPVPDSAAMLPPSRTFGHSMVLDNAPGIPQAVVPAMHIADCQPCDMNSRHPNAIRIPLTVTPGQNLGFSANDIILEDGDIILVESRENEFFMTGGLLGGGQYGLPRDRDIDILDAVLLADTYSRSSQVNTPTRAIGGVSALNRDVTVGASRVIIERKMPDGQTERFRVSLYGAMRNPDQRVLIQPGDRLFLEYTPIEAVMAFFERHLLDPFTAGAPSILTN